MRTYFGVPIVLSDNATDAQAADFKAFNTDYQLLYSLYSFPNTVLPFFGGILVDRLGVRTMCFLTVSLALVGHVIVAVGLQARSWAAMWVGRIVFGIGTESLCVAQRLLVIAWFSGAELAMAMGVILAFGRFGSVLNDNISALFGAPVVVNAYWVGVGLCGVSVLCAVAAAWLDSRFERAQTFAAALADEAEGLELEEGGSPKATAAAAAKTAASSRGGSGRAHSKVYSPLLQAVSEGAALDDGVGDQATRSLLAADHHSHHYHHEALDRRSSRSGSSGSLSREGSSLVVVVPTGINSIGATSFEVDATGALQPPTWFSSGSPTSAAGATGAGTQPGHLATSGSVNSSSTSGNEPRMSDERMAAAEVARVRGGCCKRMAGLVRQFDVTFIIIMGTVLVAFPPVTSFNGVGSALLTARAMAQGRDTSNGAIEATLGVLYTVSAIVAPLAGGFIDWAQRRLGFVAAAQTLILTSHILLAFAPGIPAVYLLGMLGFGFAFFASAFWTAVAYAAPPQAKGLAYGVVGAMQNLGLAVIPLVAAVLEPPACEGAFGCVETLFAALAGAAVILTAVGHVAETRAAVRAGTPPPSLTQMCSSAGRKAASMWASLRRCCGAGGRP